MPLRDFLSALTLPTVETMSHETEGEVLRCVNGPWDGTTYLLSPGMAGVRLSAHEEGYDTRSGDDFLGWYERDGRVLRWRPRAETPV